MDLALRLNPLQPDYRLRRSEDLPSSGSLGLADYVAARESAETAVRLQPADATYAWGLARVEARACLELFRDTAARDRALARFERAQTLAPSDVRISIDAGQFLLSAGDPAGARRLAERALGVEPNAVPARLLLAESLLASGSGDSLPRARVLLEGSRALAARWEDEARRGIYAAEMLRLDRRAVARIERELGRAGEPAP